MRRAQQRARSIPPACGLMLLMLLMPMVMGLATVTASRAGTWTVLPDGTGDFATIQAAIDAAQAGDVIELGDGTFTGDGNRDLDFGGKGLVLRSASGVAGACVIDCGGSASDPHRAFYFHTGEPADARVADLTITGGFADTGGAVAIFYKASPAFDHCVFTVNQALTGGAVFLRGSSTSTFTDCILLQNTASGNEPSGGGLHCDGSSALFDRCRFESNVASGFGATGGGVACVGSSARFTDCEFTGNAATEVTDYCAGGGLHTQDGGPQLVNCLFRNNSAGLNGGAICCIDDALELETCTLVGNRGGLGGGISCCGTSAMTLTRCTLRDNATTNGGATIALGCYAHAEIELSILASGSGGPAVECAAVSTATLHCCVIHGHAEGDWTGCIASQLGVDGNLESDPLFCTDSLAVAVQSPCHPDSNACGEQIGAGGIGCSTGVLTMPTWGRIKARYR
jgi:predicted outer membrane repeat protein